MKIIASVAAIIVCLSNKHNPCLIGLLTRGYIDLLYSAVYGSLRILSNKLKKVWVLPSDVHLFII